MPRTKGYDRDEAIEKAKVAFWQYGYQTLGVRTIEELTGISRFAIRTDFGGKEGLFLEALESYTADLINYVIKPLQANQSLQGIVQMLENLVMPTGSNLRCFGCLVTNTIIEEQSLQSKRVKQHTDHHFGILRQTLSDLLYALQKADELRADLSIKDEVEYLIGAVIAINVLNRQVGSIEAGCGYAKVAIKSVKSWKNPQSNSTE